MTDALVHRTYDARAEVGGVNSAADEEGPLESFPNGCLALAGGTFVFDGSDDGEGGIGARLAEPPPPGERQRRGDQHEDDRDPRKPHSPRKKRGPGLATRPNTTTKGGFGGEHHEDARAFCGQTFTPANQLS